jgi:hypothetical protein
MYPFQKGSVQKIFVPTGAGCINFARPLIFEVEITAQDTQQTQTASVSVVFSEEACSFILKDVAPPNPGQGEVTLAGVGTRYYFSFFQGTLPDRILLFQDILVVV